MYQFGSAILNTVNSLWMPSGPGALPDFSDLIADDTSGVVMSFSK